MLVDTHVHLFWDSFKDDFDEMIQRVIDSGVGAMINVGVDVKLSKKATEQSNYLNNKYSLSEVEGLHTYSSIAIHPEEAIKYWSGNEQETIDKIQKDIELLELVYLENPETVIAVGECGLDFAYFNRQGYLPQGLTLDAAKNLQRILFQSHIDLAKKHNLPLLIHCRDDRSQNPDNTECWDEVIEMTNDHFGVYHCYSGLPSTTHHLPPNFLISFAGNLTYAKNDYLREAVKFLPLEKILLETDCPFLPPQSIRGQRNEPSSVKEIAQLIAELKGITLEEVANQTSKNFYKLIQTRN